MAALERVANGEVYFQARGVIGVFIGATMRKCCDSPVHILKISESSVYTNSSEVASSTCHVSLDTHLPSPHTGIV